MTIWRHGYFGMAWGLGLLLVSACAPPRAPAVATPGRAPLQADAPTLDRLWLRQKQRWLLRQTALLETGQTRLTLNALLQLDMRNRSARLVAMDDFGVKLFDLTITAAGEDRHFLLPALTRIPGIDRMIAAAVRRIYLLPVADSPDRAGPDSLTVGDGGLLLERHRDLRHEHWQVRYLSYRNIKGILHPAHLVAEDQDADYRLTVWTEEVKEDEQP